MTCPRICLVKFLYYEGTGELMKDEECMFKDKCKEKREGDFLTVKVNVKNVPDGVGHGYLVATVDSSDPSKLWYYGLYNDKDKAIKAANEIFDGIVVETFSDEVVDKAIAEVKRKILSSLAIEVSKMQTYKICEGDSELYVEREDVLCMLNEYFGEDNNHD